MHPRSLMRRVCRAACRIFLHLGYYDTQYADRTVPDCRGRLRTDREGRFGYRAVVPVAYPIPDDVRPHRLPFPLAILLTCACGTCVYVDADVSLANRAPSPSYFSLSDDTTSDRTTCTS